MGGGDWWLEPIADFFYLLRERGELKSALQKRFKKDPNALQELFAIIERIDEMGYDDGVEFAFDCKYMDTVRNDEALKLIEIRVKKRLWRVITYWDRGGKRFVMIDAFEAHKHKSMGDMVKQVKPKVAIAKRLLGECE